MQHSEASRSKTLKNNIQGSTVYKGLNVLFNLLLIRYAIDYVGEEKYGIWLAILSFFTWFSALEAGVSKGFRNKLTTYFTDNNFEQISILTARAYKALGVIYIVLISALLVISFLTPIELLFIPEGSNDPDLKLAFRISMVFYFLHFVFYFLNTLLLSTHHAKATYLITAIQNGFILLGIVLFNYLEFPPSLLLICIWFSAVPLITWVITSKIAYRSYLKKLTPSFKYLLNEKSKPLKSINPSFLLIQLSMLVVFSTDNIIIINYLTGKDVTFYTIAFKYFNILIVLFNIVLLPYWASFTEAYHLKDRDWIQSNIRKLIKYWMGILGAGIVMIAVSNWAFSIWIGKSIELPLSLSFFMCLSVLLTAWNNIFAFFLNGISKIVLQRNLLIISAVLNIPLSIVLLQNYNSTGVIIATCIALLPLSFALPIQYFSIIKQMK